MVHALGAVEGTSNCLFVRFNLPNGRNTYCGFSPTNDLIGEDRIFRFNDPGTARIAVGYICLSFGDCGVSRGVCGVSVRF